jgi:hypothetical protein
MSNIVDYSDSDNEDDNNNNNNNNNNTNNAQLKRRKIAPPPQLVYNTFSKTPLKVTIANTYKNDKDNTIKFKKSTLGLTNLTSFIYFPVLLNKFQNSQVFSIVTKIKEHFSYDYNIKIKNLLINSLTLNANELHISITNNINTTKQELDIFMKQIRSDEHLKAITFPMSITCNNKLKFMPNKDKSKYFAVLSLDTVSVERLRPFVDYTNCHLCTPTNTSFYNANNIHISIAEISYQNNTNFNLLNFNLNSLLSAIDNTITTPIHVGSLAITLGRTIETI